MACQIKRNSNGTITQVLAPNGKNSILYRDIVNNLSNPQVLAQVKQDPYVSMVLGTEYIKGTDVSEVGLAAWSKAYSAGFINQFGDWKTQTIANTDINGEPNVDVLFPSTQITSIGPATFDKQLAQKIQAKLQALYPEIKLNITNNPVWEKGGNIFNQEQFNLEVNYRLKTTKVVLDNYNKIRQWESNKSIDQDILYKKIGELGISNQQLELLKESEGNTVEEKLASFTANYSYTVEINTAKQKTENIKQINATYFEVDGIDYTEAFGSWFKNEGTTKISYDEYKKALDKYNQQNVEEKPTQHYSSLTVPGGTNYRENEIATPAITPNIKGHAQFATDKGIGWFRSDEQVLGRKYGNEKQVYNPNIEDIEFITPITVQGTATKTRRILEVQSDLFQKGRDKEQLIGIDFDLQGAGYTFGSRNQYKIIDEYNDEIVFKDTETGDVYKKPKEWLKEQNKKVQVKKSENQFLQLLNKNNNWINFFIKAIVQDSAKKGYEKVLFPSGDTASKVEGHTTLEEFKKQKEDRIKELEKDKEYRKLNTPKMIQQIIDTQEKLLKHNPSDKLIKDLEENKKKLAEPVDTSDLDNEINQLKQELERVEREGFGALKPVYNFYETTVANVLKKQGYDPKIITDEYGNTWNEVNINQARDLSEILLQRNKANQIIGQANIKALTVLIDAVNQKQDTLPHEYAHHYIAWYRNTPIVQEAIKKWGSEEALVQAIGEQVVKQKGEAYNWWKNFVRWILNQFNKLSTLQKEELAKILTDAFLTRQDLNIQPDLKTSNVKEGVDFVFEQNPELASIGTQEQYSEYLDTIFPDSKVKDIVYRGDENYNVGEKILSRVGGNKYTNGIYFAKNRREAAGYINDIKKKTTHVFSAILDLKAPKVTDVYDKEINTNALTETDINNLKSKNIDGLDVGLSGEQGFEYLVFEPEQIHILGSKQDIEGFKKFVSGGQLPSTVDNIINMKRWTQTKNNCPKL